MSPRDFRRPLRTWLFLFFLALYIATSSGHIVMGDEETMFQVTRNLVEHGHVAVTNHIVMVPPASYQGYLPTREYHLPTTITSYGRSGRHYSPYGPAQSLAALPLYEIGKVLGQLVPVSLPEFLPRLAMQLLNAFFLAATAALVAEFSWEIGAGITGGVFLAAAFGLSTMVWPYVKTFFSEPGTALFLFLAAYAMARFDSDSRQGWLFVSGLALGTAQLFRITAWIAAPALLAYLLWIGFSKWRGGRPHWRTLALFVLGCLPGVIGTAFYNWLRFGSPVAFGYSWISWDTPFLDGFYGLLFSPGKGVFLYAPVVTLGVVGLLVMAQARPAEAFMIGLLGLSYVCFHSTYAFWTGGWNWGPRFLLPALPFIMLPIAVVFQKARTSGAYLLFGVMVALGVAIQLPAVLVDHSRYLVALSEQYDHFYDRSIFEPSMSPIVQQWPTALEVIGHFRLDETRAQVAQLLATLARETDYGLNPEDAQDIRYLRLAEFLRLNVPDCWAVHLVLLGASPLVAFGLVGLLGLVILGAAIQIIRQTRQLTCQTVKS